MAIEDFDQVTIEPAKLRPFSKFIMSIGELPTSYLDSLSYAEQVTWFCDYLQNNVIPALNNNAEALEEVQGLMTELQEYVDNYFTDLDVQNEINNKLDKMAEDGTLTELLSVYLTPIVNQQNMRIDYIENKVDSVASGSPLVASSVSEMTDTDRVYVNTTNGYWYYYDGTEWVQGGIYQATGIQTDQTLTQSGQAADAKVTGLKISNLENGQQYTSFDFYNDIELSKQYAFGSGNLSINDSVRTSAILPFDVTGGDILSCEMTNNGTSRILFFQGLTQTSDTTWTYEAINNSNTTQSGDNSATCPAGYTKAVIFMTVPSGVVSTDNPLTTEILMNYLKAVGITTKTHIYELIEENAENIQTLASAIDTKRLTGKKIVCFGDSITEGVGSTDVQYTYPYIIEQTTGATVYNVGLGGTRWYKSGAANDVISCCSLIDSIVNNNWDDVNIYKNEVETSQRRKDHIDLLETLNFNNIDIVCFNYGTNDWYATGNPNAYIDGANLYDQHKVWGGVRYCIRTLLENYPHLKVYVTSPIYRARQEAGDGKDSDNYPKQTSGGVDVKYLYEYNNELINVIHSQHQVIKDMYYTSGICKWNAGTLLADGLHPSDSGYVFIGNEISNFILSN